MCSHYEAPSYSRLLKTFDVESSGQGRLDLWPTSLRPFTKRASLSEDPDTPAAQVELLEASFGQIPGWRKDGKIARRTYCKSV